MRRIALRCITLTALAALGGAATAQTFPPLVAPPDPSASSSPACAKNLVASSGTPKSRDEVVAERITLALHTGTPCIVAGFPGIVFAGHAAAPVLRTGRLSNPSSALLDPQTQATFTLRYVRAPGASAAGCALRVVITGTPAGGAPLPSRRVKRFPKSTSRRTRRCRKALRRRRCRLRPPEPPRARDVAVRPTSPFATPVPSPAPE